MTGVALAGELQPDGRVHPIRRLSSLLFFGVPGLIIFVGVRFGVPAAEAAGIDPAAAFIVALYGPFACFIPLTLWLYQREGNPWTWAHFRARFRMGKLSARSWLLVAGAFVIIQLAEGLLAVASRPLLSSELLGPPAHVPGPFNGDIELPLQTFLGFSTAGNSWLILLWCGCLVANIGGEELLWRGYLLPREELRSGEYAWLLHGLMWCFLLHFFMPWQWLAILPSNLVLPWLAQRMQSFWPSFALHGLGNALVFAVLVPATLSQ